MSHELTPGQDALFASPVGYYRVPRAEHEQSEYVVLEPEEIETVADPQLREVLGRLSMHGSRRDGWATIVYAHYDDTLSHAIRVPTKRTI